MISIRAIIREEDFPELAGDALLIWTVSTVTGQSVVVECDEDFDFIPPEVDILLECDCDATTTVVPIRFTDGAGLKDANVWFDESVPGLIKKVTFDATPTGESTTTFTSGFDYPGWEFPATGTIYEVNATIELDPAKIVSPTLGGSYTVYAYAEDTSCNVSDEASETCAIDFVAPTITYFGLDCVGTDCDLCEATETALVWHIRDVNFDYAEISVNYGNLCSDGQCGNTFIAESTDGTVLWEFPFADCREITATIKAVDDCENESSKTIKFDVDNVPPELDLEWCVEPETCDATFARFSWTMDDPCTPTVYFERSIQIGELEYVVMGNGKEHTIEYTSDGTTTQSGIIQWSWDGWKFDCTELTILATAEDYRCENRTEASLTTDVEIDHFKPYPLIFLGDREAVNSRQAARQPIWNRNYIYDPSCDASCLWVNFVVWENCLESFEIWTNYPSVCETGGTGEYLEDEYLLLSWPEMSVNIDEDSWILRTKCGGGNGTAPTPEDSSELLDEANGSYEQPIKAYWGSIKVCLPSNLDCEDFVATITAVQTCKPDIDDPETYTSEEDDSALIDRKAPELEFGWEDGITPTQCATEATLTVSITDGSFPCKICGEGDCQIGLLEWEFRPVGGTIVTGVDLPVFESDLTLDGDTYYGSLYVEAPQGQECGTYVATFTAYDCCCSIGYANKKVSGPVSVYVDTKDPIINDFYFSDKDGVESQEWEACGATNTYLFWDATDTCFTDIEIEVSDGVLVWGNWLTTDATGVVEWRFGEVSGETLIATLTAYDQCNESDAVSLSAYVRNTGPVLWSGTSFRFDAQSDTIVLRFNEEVITDSATAVLYFRTNPDDDWLAMATYSGGTSGGIYSGSTGDDYVVVEVAEYDATNIVGTPEIVLGTQYKLELFDIYASDDAECQDKEFYTEPNPIVVEGQGTALSPEL
ncbi:hypothetical protein [Mesotoga sp.]|uniref:hypothetical protein n=1 Tax=Mesotoga sp. TaxID=2053577 RepID=UPI00345E5E15